MSHGTYWGKLDGATAVVTGAASGTREATARLFAAEIVLNPIQGRIVPSASNLTSCDPRLSGAEPHYRQSVRSCVRASRKSGRKAHPSNSIWRT